MHGIHLYVTDWKHCVTDYFLCYVIVCINSVCTYLLFSSSPCTLLKVLATGDRRAQGEGVTLRWRTRTGSGGHSCWRVRLLARECPRVDGNWASVALHLFLLVFLNNWLVLDIITCTLRNNLTQHVRLHFDLISHTSTKIYHMTYTAMYTPGSHIRSACNYHAPVAVPGE